MLFSASRNRYSSNRRWTIGAGVALLGLLSGLSASPAAAHNSRPTGPPGYTYAATEGQHFNVGFADVAYGANGKFNRKTAQSGRVNCDNSTFGDPNKHVHKSCFTLNLAGPAGYSYAATEHSHFTINGLADVAYGANGKFNRKTAMSGHVNCENSTFGDPYKTVHKSCYILSLVGPKGYTYAVPEGAHVSFSGLADVAYGDRGKFNRKTGVNGGIDCTNAVFGNPDPGVQKACYILPDIGPAGFTYAGTEGVHITFNGTADVAYGDRGMFALKTGVNGGIDCTNAVFGNPDPGVQKQCYIKAVASGPPPAGPSGFTYAASEGSHFTVSGTADVAYGADGFFILKRGLSGDVACTNATFGNPNPGVVKACFVK